MPAEIRDARREDSAAIAELLSLLGYERRPDFESTLTAWLADSASRLFVAELDGQLAGVVALHSWPHPARPGARARITALALGYDEVSKRSARYMRELA